ncbi:MAG: M1 family metallopeptidase, partial [Gemmatimonadaceae bacterium]
MPKSFFSRQWSRVQASRASTWAAALLTLPMLTNAAPTSLYMPRAVTKAYAKGTRSPDGRPGKNYWQNSGKYAITITAAPPNRTVTGSEQINYANNSPDTLSSVVIKLFLNIHKPGAPRQSGASDDYLNSGIHIDAFSVNGQKQSWSDVGAFTYRRVRLPMPLMPHDSIKLAFDWHYEISKEAGREGMLDANTFYLAYFYPRVAVYDDYNGWDTMDFTDAQEFYSDFNDYDVTLKLPANYVVWGTGTFTNASDVLQAPVAERYRASLTSDEVIHVVTAADLAAHQVTTQGNNSWHFVATNVPDVTFNISDHYVWDAASVFVDTAKGRRASVQAAFNDNAADFHHMVEFGRHSLFWLSHNWPGVPYPYEKTTIVQGSADMEYPMMVNDSSTPDTIFSRFVAEHEIAHTWFPFYMGINETRYAFMDEGWATTFEYLIGTNDLGAKRAIEFFKDFRVKGWISDPSPVQDLPIITPEDVLNGSAWGNNAYGKAALGYLAVKDMLGDEQFGKALREFMARWNGKHPIPWDFFNTMNDVTKKDLNWFWRNWYFTNGYIDLAISNVVKNSTNVTVTVQNIGGFVAPFDLSVTYADGTTEVVHKSSAFWEANQTQGMATISTKKAVTSITLDGGIWMDADTTNNSWKP